MITLATLPQATAQEVFDQVKNHLLTQNKKSTVGTGTTCLYRGAGGLKCAAGCLIGDDEYKKEMEHNNWDDLVDAKIVPSNHSKLILELQKIHDGNIEYWEYSMERLAKEKGLIY